MKQSDRALELRHALVTTVDATPYQRRLPRRALAVAAVAGFVLAGAATGGAVASSFGDGNEPTEERVQLSGHLGQDLVVGTHADLFGEAVNLLGQGTTVIDLGEIPDGATALAFSIDCVDPGDYTTTIDDRLIGTEQCTAESIAQVGGGGLQFGVEGSGTHTLTISGPGRYIIWAQWSAEHPVPPSSAAQTEAMADGVITREEYVAGWDRYNACMVGAGYYIDGGNRDAPIILGSIPAAAVDDGTDRLCYEPEFQDIDMAWQIAHEDESETTQALRDCLTAHGIVPAYSRVDVDQQLAENGIDVLDCFT